MAYVVVTLFEHPDRANEGMNALERAGFNRSNMECIESDPESQKFFKRLFTTDGGEEMEAERAMEFLTEMGIPEDDAEDYSDKVRKGKSMVLVRCSSEAEAEEATNILNQDTLKAGEKELRHGETRSPAAGEEATVEAAEEELTVGKREVETGGVRIEKEVTEEPVEEEVQLREEHVDVERRQVDRPLGEGEEAFTEESIEVSETREEPVAEKKQRVREEVKVKKDVEDRSETVKETVRRETINVRDISERAEGRFNQFESDYRAHFDENYADTDHEFNDYSMGYQYGMGLAESDEYRGANWEEVEPEARQSWEAQGDDMGAWEEFKDSVRYGWRKIRGEEDPQHRRPGRR